mmetsp:Transcript_3248/g.13343  ORF Transcript_3248/g.13343 Transcript_3248/m.13343 type:complete len:221 (-) Transcript_3248:1506-2168(-)
MLPPPTGRQATVIGQSPRHQAALPPPALPGRPRPRRIVTRRGRRLSGETARERRETLATRCRLVDHKSITRPSHPLVLRPPLVLAPVSPVLLLPPLVLACPAAVAAAAAVDPRGVGCQGQHRLCRILPNCCRRAAERWCSAAGWPTRWGRCRKRRGVATAASLACGRAVGSLASASGLCKPLHRHQALAVAGAAAAAAAAAGVSPALLTCCHFRQSRPVG